MAFDKEELSALLDKLSDLPDKKLEPVLSEISSFKEELRLMSGFVDLANSKYEEVTKNFEVFKDEKIKLQSEN